MQLLFVSDGSAPRSLRRSLVTQSDEVELALSLFMRATGLLSDIVLTSAENCRLLEA